MSITFNAALRGAELDPRNVRLIRHRKAFDVARNLTAHQLWRDNYQRFLSLQSTQSARTDKIIGLALFLASFVDIPTGETMFVGVYRIASKRFAPAAPDAPGEQVIYALRERPELSGLIAKLIIDWGGGSDGVQRAETNDKTITELCREPKEPKSEGYRTFMERLSDAEDALYWRLPSRAI